MIYLPIIFGCTFGIDRKYSKVEKAVKCMSYKILYFEKRLWNF